MPTNQRERQCRVVAMSQNPTDLLQGEDVWPHPNIPNSPMSLKWTLMTCLFSLRTTGTKSKAVTSLILACSGYG